jgi:hypothetical protein
VAYITVKIIIVWDITLCNSAEIYKYFAGTHCFQLPGRRISQPSKPVRVKQQAELYLLLAGRLLGLFVDPEDGGYMFSETSVNFYMTTRRHTPEDNHCREDHNVAP